MKMNCSVKNFFIIKQEMIQFAKYSVASPVKAMCLHIAHDCNLRCEYCFASTGAVMAFRLLDNLSMPADEICSIISAIGNHDESTAQPVDAISAALIIADKADVRRSRVRNNDFLTFDIHDRVNYAVEKSELYFSEDKSSIILNLKIDTEISPVIEYFEIFLNRMLLCKRACSYLGVQFKMIVNGSSIL